MFDPPVEEVINLLPCAICSAPFDPATLPSHVYDPYQTFLLFTHHSSICPSCFAEELAKRTRPDPDTFGQVSERPVTQQTYRAIISGRHDSAATVISQHRTFHKKSSSIATIPRSASTPIESDARSAHRKSNSVSTFSRSGSQRETRSHDMLRSQNSMRESRSSHETSRHRPSTSIGRPSTSTGFSSTTSQKTSPELPQRSQGPSPEIPRRSTSRGQSHTQSQRPSPDLSRPSQERPMSRNRPSSEAPRKSAEGMRRKVSFRQGAPIPQSFNPHSPPYHTSQRVPPLPEQHTPTQIPPQYDVPLSPPEPESAPAPNRLPAMLGMHHPHSVVQDITSLPSSKLSWSSWRIRRRQEREAREQRWQAKKEQQSLRKMREEKEKGIGLDLFCPQCQVVVRTTPKWRDGSCCVLYSSCLFVCTGPFCLCLFLPCASRQVLDVDGRCPNCTTTLSTWNRRKNQLTILTWAGVRNSDASESLPSLAPRPHVNSCIPRQLSVRMPPAPMPPNLHYSRPRTATVGSGYSRPRTATVSSAAPTSISIMSGSRPRTMSSAQQTTTVSTARSSGGSPPLTTRSSPSSRMAASATGTASSNRTGTTGSSSNRTGTVSHAGTGNTANSASTGTTLVNTGPAPHTAIPYQQHFEDTGVVATDFAEFLQDPVGQEYLQGNHAITHAGTHGHAVQVIVPQQLLEDMEMEEVGRAIG
jgi:hypothetical protein